MPLFLQQAITPYVNPKSFGATGNGKQISNGVITSGANILSAASGSPFAPNDVGKVIVVIDPATKTPAVSGTITGYGSPTQVSLSANSTITITSGGLVCWGTDDGPALRAARDFVQPTGGIIQPSPGMYMVGSTETQGSLATGLMIPGSVELLGTGIEYSDPTLAPPHLASVIMAATPMDVLVMLGPFGSGGNSVAGQTAPIADNIILDGRNLAVATIQTESRRGELRFIQSYWGSSYAVEFVGQNNKIRGGIYCQSDNGDVMHIRQGGDHKVYDAEFRQPGTTGAAIRIMAGTGFNTNDLLISRNHLYSGANGVAAAAQGLIVLDLAAGATTNLRIDSNIIEGVIGPEILFNVASTTSINAWGITNNQFFNANSVNTTPAIQWSGGGGVQTGLITGNTFSGNSTSDYKSMLDTGSALAFSDRVVMADNTGWFIDGIITGTAPNRITQKNNSVRNATVTVRSNNGGKATFSGTGVATAFTIPHGLSATPIEWNITPGSAAGAAIIYATVDATNITVNFLVAPGAGTNNVVLLWTASQ